MPVHADSVVFDTFGPGHTYNQISGPTIGGPSNVEIAALFVAGVSGNLATVELGLTFTTSPIPLNVFLYGDIAISPDNANQTLLGSVTPTAQFLSNNSSLVTLTIGATVPLIMGTRYWLVLKPMGPSPFTDVWNLSGNQGLYDTSFDDSHWLPLDEGNSPAFRLTAREGNAVPESGNTFGLLLMALGVFALGKLSAMAVTRSN